MALQELLLSSSSALTSLHDVRTGSLVTSFKASSAGDQNYQVDSATNGKGKGKATESASSSVQWRKTSACVESKNGQGGLVMNTVAGGRAAMNVWSFQREAPLHRLLLPVKLACVSLSKSGVYLAGGAHDGRLLLWEISTGSLLASFDAHYRSITCLAWTDDDAALISGSDDAAAHVWSLPSMLASSSNPLLPVAPYISLSDHTLPVSDIVVGFGSFPRVRVLTGSLDGSCKLWDLTLRGLPLLSSFAFPSSSQITHVALDALERHFFAVSVDPTTSTSSVHKVDLYQRTRRGEAEEDGDNAEAGSEDDEEEDQEARNGPGSFEALGGGGRGDIERVEIASDSRPGKIYTLQPSKTHGTISAFHLSPLSATLLIGTSLGMIQVLSLPSLQVIRTISPSVSSSAGSLNHPITYLSTLLRPIDLVSRTGAGAEGAANGSKDEVSIQPRYVNAQLSRTLVQPGGKEVEEKVVMLRLGRQEDVTDSILPPQVSYVDHSATAVPLLAMQNHASLGEGGQSLQTVQEENARLREQLARSLAMNERMWEKLVDGTISKAKPQGDSDAVMGESQ